MIGYQWNDGGRKAAGRKGKTGDCCVRALSILLMPNADDYNSAAAGKIYAEVYKFMADGMGKLKGKRSASHGVNKSVYQRVFVHYDLRKAKLPKGPRPTYTEAYENVGDCIVSTAKHLCCIRDGKLQDLFDGRTYQWIGGGRMYTGRILDNDHPFEERERKAMSVYCLPRT